MTIRERMEYLESTSLSPFATLSINSKGRAREESQCDIRPVFQRDRDRILHCKAFRRLMHKTQVFLRAEGDHYRTRLTHTLEVSQNARTIAKALRLNEDLTEAIALGHDLGHTPFGHAGEHALDEICSTGFRHNIQSVRVVELLEKNGAGLNLTFEVKDGIKNHQTGLAAATPEGCIVRYSDKIAYINHDIDDAIRALVIEENDIPAYYRDVLGNNSRERLDTIVHNIIINSQGTMNIHMSEEVDQAMKGLREFMFLQVYRNPLAKSEEDKAKKILFWLFDFYMSHVEKLPVQYVDMYYDGIEKDRVVCDYIAGMTDRYAIAKFEEFFMPKAWKVN